MSDLEAITVSMAPPDAMVMEGVTEKVGVESEGGGGRKMTSRGVSNKKKRK